MIEFLVFKSLFWMKNKISDIELILRFFDQNDCETLPPLYCPHNKDFSTRENSLAMRF